MLNLTTRKQPAPRLLGMFEKRPGETYKAKFSQAYQPAGHEFTQSFKILKLAYWLKYDLIGPQAIFVYETLQLLCELEIPFALEVLADRCGIGDATLRQALDDLENAELLEIYKTDGRGQPNFYLLRTPYFERDSIEPTGDERTDAAIYRRQKRIFAAGGELPLEFLEDHAERLRKQITTNRAKRIRALARRNFERSKSYRRFIGQLSEKRLCWFGLVKRAGDDRRAAALENIIYNLAKSIPATDSDYRIFAQRFRESCAAAGLPYSAELLEDAKQLIAFYDRHRQPATPKADKRGRAFDSIRRYLELNKTVSTEFFADFILEQIKAAGVTAPEILRFLEHRISRSQFEELGAYLKC